MVDIVIVEDDTVLREELHGFLTAQGYRVHEANTLQGLYDSVQLFPVRLVILDINLPGVDGFRIAEQLRARATSIGIIMLTARTRLDDRLEGYRVGADNYLTKPIDPQELLAAVRSLERRLGSTASTTLELDCAATRLVNADTGETVALSPLEAMLLRALALSASTATDVGDLIDLIETHFPGRATTRRAIENVISRLRRKIADSMPEQAPLVVPVRGVGYQLAVPISVR